MRHRSLLGGMAMDPPKSSPQVVSPTCFWADICFVSKAVLTSAAYRTPKLAVSVNLTAYITLCIRGDNSACTTRLLQETLTQ